MDVPISTYRSSPVECSGSSIVFDKGSRNAVLASSKDTPCLAISGACKRIRCIASLPFLGRLLKSHVHAGPHRKGD
jgi:hypothetical protein